MTTKQFIGDLFVTGGGEVYIYLGHYIGTPITYRKVPNTGHLYMICNHYKPITSEGLAHTIPWVASLGLDGHFCYTKSPKRFKSTYGHVELNKQQLNGILGLKLIDK